MLIGTIGAGTVLDAVAILIWSSSGRGVPSPVATAPLIFGMLMDAGRPRFVFTGVFISLLIAIVAAQAVAAEAEKA